MEQKELQKFEPLFGKWRIDEKIGQGSYGDVYRIQWTDFDGEINYSALKTISIPRNREEMLETQASCGTIENTRKYYDDIVRQFKNEIDMMKLLRGHSNIVFYEDHEIIPKESGMQPGYDILVRMELLQDLKQLWLKEPERMSRPDEVVRIGCDIAAALEVCQAHSVIHRDIKPANILRSVDGVYKLGDFGVARTLERGSAYTRIGTEKFIAPEIYNEKPYDFRADIYSLGLVLYYLLNDYRGPFLPAVSAVATPEDEATALLRRMKGEDFPLPRHAPVGLGRIICKACSYLPEERYANAKAFREAIGTYTENEKTVLLTPQREEKESKKSFKYAAAGAAIVLVGAGLLYAVNRMSDNKSVTTVVETETVSEAEPQRTAPVLNGEILVNPLEEGETLANSVPEISGRFEDAETGENVMGVLEWDEPDVQLEKSGEYSWTFYPENTERYTEVIGKTHVTVLISEMLVGGQEVSEVEDKASLLKVDLSGSDLSDLSILEGAVNLQYLILDNNNLTAVDELAECKSLIFVSLNNNKNLKDVSALYQIPSLESVYLEDTSVTNEDKEKLEELLTQ